MYDLCNKVFEDAPAVQRGFCNKLTVGSQYGFFFSILGIYTLSWGEGFGMLFYDVHLCKVWWILIGSLFLMPFLFTARTMGTWKSLVWINIGSLIGTIIIPLAYFAVVGIEETREPGSAVYAVNPKLGAKGGASIILSGLSTYMFAFTSQFMLVEIISEMSDSSELPKAYVGYAAPFMCFAFVLVGLVGYYYLGDAVDVMLPQNLPFGMLFRLAAICLLLHMLISYLIKAIVTCYGVHKVVHPKSADGNDAISWFYWRSIVLGAFLFAFLIANVVPFFGDFVDLVGASVTPLSCFIMPIVIYIKWYKQHGAGRTGYFEWFVIGVEMTLALVLMVSGTIAECETIVSHWKEYGAPFACHCENLWNTCECSAHHAGMESESCLDTSLMVWNMSVAA